MVNGLIATSATISTISASLNPAVRTFCSWVFGSLAWPFRLLAASAGSGRLVDGRGLDLAIE
jgi:hypothetical protein